MRRSTRIKNKPKLDASYLYTEFEFNENVQHEKIGREDDSDLDVSNKIGESLKSVEKISVNNPIIRRNDAEKNNTTNISNEEGLISETNKSSKKLKVTKKIPVKKEKKIKIKENKNGDIEDIVVSDTSTNKYCDDKISITLLTEINEIPITIDNDNNDHKSKKKKKSKNKCPSKVPDDVKNICVGDKNLIEESNFEKQKNVRENSARFTKTVSKSSKKNIQGDKLPKICLDLSKYEGVMEKSKEVNNLMRTSLALKKHFPFKDHLKHIRYGSSNKLNSNVDTCGLDNVQMSDVLQANELPSSLQSDSESHGLYFETTTSSVEKVKSNTKEIEKVMKKSVLPDDLEKMEKAPKLYESQHQKRLERKKRNEETAGKGWYNLPKPEMTDEVKRDLQLIKMRNVIDSKHHYKRNDTNKLPTYFQVGTIVEGAHEFYSARATKKERKRTMVDELLEDADLRKKNKRKLIEIQKKQMSGGKGHFKKMKNKRKPTWARM